MDFTFFKELPLFELAIPEWQIGFYVLITVLCLITQRYKLFKIITYCFCLYWGFFLYYGDVVGSFDRYPYAVTLYLISGLFLIILMLVAAFRE